ncbi:MAG: hypothetical protein R2788_00705 [Saprospiraceae bacterium]
MRSRKSRSFGNNWTGVLELASGCSQGILRGGVVPMHRDDASHPVNSTVSCLKAR